MHPSNNLLLPILRKHGDRLLKAQIEAMVKELSWEEQELFLRRQLEASVEAIQEKLATSYPDYPFLTEWEPEIVRRSLKSWVIILSGEANYLRGIEDFTLVVILLELGNPLNMIGFTPKKNDVIQIDKYSKIKNGYRIRYYTQKNDPNIYIPNRRTGDELIDWIGHTSGLFDCPAQGLKHTFLTNLLLRL